MTLSKIGAAVTLDNIETVFNWLCSKTGRLRFRTSATKYIVRWFIGFNFPLSRKLQAHKGPRGLHGPFLAWTLAIWRRLFKN